MTRDSIIARPRIIGVMILPEAPGFLPMPSRAEPMALPCPMPPPKSSDAQADTGCDRDTGLDHRVQSCRRCCAFRCHGDPVGQHNECTEKHNNRK